MDKNLPTNAGDGFDSWSRRFSHAMEQLVLFNQPPVNGQLFPVVIKPVSIHVYTLKL